MASNRDFCRTALKKLLKSILTFLLVLLLAGFLVVVILLVVLQTSLPGLLLNALADTTGFPVTAVSSDCSLLSMKVEAKNITITSPREFPTATFVEITHLNCDFGRDGTGLFQVDNLELHLASIHLADSPSGHRNLVLFAHEAGPFALDLLDQVSNLLGDGTFPRIVRGELTLDRMTLPDGSEAKGFPRKIDLSGIRSGQALLRILREAATP